MLFFTKFFVFVAWYRWMDKGNILEITRKLFWLRFLFDLIIYGFKIWLIMNVMTDDGDAWQYVMIGAMIVKEVYLYFACVQRADEKLRREAFDSNLGTGLQALIRKAQSSLVSMKPRTD